MEQVVNYFLALLDRTECFLRSSLLRRSPEPLADFLCEFRIKRLHPLHKRMLLQASSRFVVSLAGLTNVGKSTLVHALFRHPIAPCRNGPATAIPVEYEYSDSWHLTMHNARDKTVRTHNFKSAEELGADLVRRVFNLTSADATKTGKILVRGPIEILRGGLVFADTPGFGAAHLDPDGANHNEALSIYLANHVQEVMFCVSGANCMIRSEEVSFFDSIRDLCSTVIVTKWDDDDNGRTASEYRDRFMEQFPLCGFRFVEAKFAVNGRQEESGIESLKEHLAQRSTKESRIKSLEEQVSQAWSDLLELSLEPARKAGLAAVPWHKAALPRFIKAAEQRNLYLTS